MFDVAIVGAGIAGASLAAEIAPHRRVVLLEREDQPGYHATGRSASFWDECYGGPFVQPLTRASYDFLRQPPTEFSPTGFLRQRGVLYLGTDDERHALGAFMDDFAGRVHLERLDRAALISRIPGLRPQWTGGVFGSDCSDIDVAALHGAYLRAARRAGAELRCRAGVTQLERDGGGWRILAGDHEVRAQVVINAGGAWADQLAVMAGVKPIGMTPYRRTIAQVRVHPGPSEDLPLVIHIGGDFYFKPETGGQIWLSPHDETPSEACDVAPEELDIAIAIDRFSHVLDCTIGAVTHKWAGLRTFAPDRLPVFGFDSDAPGFFWCAGQGGFGIQTAPAAAKLCAAAILEQPLPPGLGPIEPGRFDPARFKR
jgi:D-arginine dehydrogenase